MKGEVDKALDSKSSMNKLATIGEMVEPMSTPYVISQNSPSKLKKVEVRQISTNLALYGVVICLIISMASFIGLLA